MTPKITKLPAVGSEPIKLLTRTANSLFNELIMHVNGNVLGFSTKHRNLELNVLLRKTIRFNSFSFLVFFFRNKWHCALEIDAKAPPKKVIVKLLTRTAHFPFQLFM